MYTFNAERVIAVPPSVLPAAIDELVAGMWSDRASRINEEQPAQTFVIAGIDGSPDQTTWLSFRVTGNGSSSHVRVTLDEFAPGPDPTEALADLLDLLAINTTAPTQPRRLLSRSSPPRRPAGPPEMNRSAR